MKLVGNVNILYGYLKSENSKDYAQKPQRNFMFMNSASGFKVDAGAESLPREKGDAGLQPLPDPLLSLGLLTGLEVK